MCPFLHLLCAVTARGRRSGRGFRPQTMDTDKDIGCPSLVEMLEPMLHEYGVYDQPSQLSCDTIHQALPTTLPAQRVVLRRRHQSVTKATLRYKPPA